MRLFKVFVYIIVVFICYNESYAFINQRGDHRMNQVKMPDANVDTITLGAGCFWCVETIYEQLKGVFSVESGYSGGTTIHPTYREVCTGETGHAEVCQITYDPSIIRFEDILEVFWSIHDPTTLNRQGADIGTQYRSVIFYHTDNQREIAEALKKKLNGSGEFRNPIVTEIEPFVRFFRAEDYHQDYFNNNPAAPYCNVVISPKVEKFQKMFREMIK